MADNGYTGKIKNDGMMYVQAPHQKADPKHAKVKTGTDLRAGKSKK